MRRKKLEEAKRINRQFHQDPESVCCSFKKIIENQDDTENPKYDSGRTDKEDNQERFNDITEATGLWKFLWEGEGTGNVTIDWFEEIRRAICERVPLPPGGSLQLEHSQSCEGDLQKAKLERAQLEHAQFGAPKLITTWVDMA